MSLLDTVAHLLSLGTRDPMRCKDIVDLAIQWGLWSSRNGGKTPAATLHAAISREIKTKGASQPVCEDRARQDCPGGQDLIPARPISQPRCPAGFSSAWFSITAG